MTPFHGSSITGRNIMRAELEIFLNIPVVGTIRKFTSNGRILSEIENKRQEPCLVFIMIPSHFFVLLHIFVVNGSYDLTMQTLWYLFQHNPDKNTTIFTSKFTLIIEA